MACELIPIALAALPVVPPSSLMAFCFVNLRMKDIVKRRTHIDKSIYKEKGINIFMSYGKRLETALIQAGKDRKSLAKYIDCSVQSIGMVITGATKQLSTSANSRAAEFLKVDPHWLVTGDGDMSFKGYSHEPLESTLSPAAQGLGMLFDQLPTARDRAEVHGIATGAILKRLAEHESPLIDTPMAIDDEGKPSE